MASSTGVAELVEHIKKLGFAVHEAYDIHVLYTTNKVPEAYRGLVMYYSPAGMKSKRPPAWVGPKVQEVKLPPPVDPKLLRAYRYKR